MSRRPTPRRTAIALVAAVLAVVPALSSCSGGDTMEGAKNPAGGYIAGKGQVEKAPADKRGDPVTLAGTTLDDRQWALADHKDTVVVVNLWGSWCAPCEAEMPMLKSAAQQFAAAKTPVTFVGIDLEPKDTGLAASKRYGLPYPSISDPSGASRLGLQAKAEATPTTLVLDRQGRIAARIVGAVPSETTLKDLVQEVVAE